ncbi:MAG: HutD/Ves family protein, partial [Polymorphobacter sp.]
PHKYRAQPWRNGGGVAHEIHTEASTHEDHDFDWRASIALVHADLPFSEYPGVDRSLVLLGDGGASLVNNRVAVAMTPDSQPFTFAGEDEVEMALAEKPVLVFNLMSRRGVRHTLSRKVCSPETRFGRTDKAQLLFALDNDHLLVDGVAQPRHSSVLIAPHGRAGHELQIAFAGHGSVLHAEIH